MMKSKIVSLQILRAFAAILVVINHLWGDSKTALSTEFGLEYVGDFGVDAFFILSGFIMGYKTREDSPFGMAVATHFIRRRIERIYPIFLIVLIPFILIYLKQTHFISPYEIIGNVLLLPSFNNNPQYHMLIGPSWSLVYEMFFYVVYAAFMMFVSTKKQLITYSSALLIAMVLGVKMLSIQGYQLGNVNFSYMIGDPLMINFAMGCIFSQVFDRLKNIKIAIPLASLMIGVIFVLGMWLSSKGEPRFFSFGLPAMLIVFLFSVMDSSETKTYKLLVYLGNASYSIYITHFFIEVIAGVIFYHSAVNKDLYGIALSIICLIIGCLFYSLIEKRVTKLMHNFEKKDNALRRT